MDLDPLLVLANYGAFAFVLLLVVIRKLTTVNEADQWRQVAADRQEKIDEMTTKMMQEVIPALTRVTDATVKATDVMMNRAANGR